MTKKKSAQAEKDYCDHTPDLNRARHSPEIMAVTLEWQRPHDIASLRTVAFECGRILKTAAVSRTDVEAWLRYSADMRSYNKVFDPAVVQVTISLGLSDGMAQRVPANDNEPRAVVALPKMHPTPFTTEAAGGILGEVSASINCTAIIPIPELALASAIALLGGLFGDRALGPTRSGTNLFMTTVMGVASGKGHAPKCIIRLAQSAGRPGAVTNGDPTSYSAIERLLRKSKSTVVVMDEFGITLQDVNSRQNNSNAASIRKMLLAIYDQADSIFYGRVYASDDTKKDDSPIDGPALTVLGMTTAKTLYDGLTPDSLGNGFLSRFVFLTGTHPDSIAAPRLGARNQMPASLLGMLRNAVETFPKVGDGGNLSFLKKYVVPFLDGEEGDAYKRWIEVFHWQHWKGWTDIERDVNGRAAENTIRLATVRAISRDPKAPAVNVEDIEWGWAIVHRSIQIINDGVSKYMSGSTTEALRKAIVAALADAKDHTLAWSHILQRQGVSQAEADDVSKALQWLIDTGQVLNVTNTGQKPGARARFKLLNP